MKSQAQIRRPGRTPIPRGDRGPGEAEIPEARLVDHVCDGIGGPQGRSRMNEVAAA
jgi:hypothetical protein